jgi:hypothetical protein
MWLAGKSGVLFLGEIGFRLGELWAIGARAADFG